MAVVSSNCYIIDETRMEYKNPEERIDARSVVMIHDDKKNVASMHNVFNRYEHFKGVEKIESMIFCDNIEDLENKFNESWENKNSVDLKKIDQQRNHILYNDEKSYQTRLTELINQLLE